MPTPDRSFADVLQDIVGNIQEIVRSEVRLAKAEISEEARKAKPAGLSIAAGAVFGLCAHRVRTTGSRLRPLDRDAELGGGACRERGQRPHRRRGHPRRADSIDADRPDAGQDDSESEGERGMVETTAQIETHIETTRENARRQSRCPRTEDQVGHGLARVLSAQPDDDRRRGLRGRSRAGDGDRERATRVEGEAVRAPPWRPPRLLGRWDLTRGKS